jgi:hypothetical protein
MAGYKPSQNLFLAALHIFWANLSTRRENLTKVNSNRRILTKNLRLPDRKNDV